MEKTTFKAYAGPAKDNPDGCDHVAVASDDGGNWGCFGRGAGELMSAPGGRFISQGQGYRRWAELIAQDDSGLVNLKSGRCHNLANRILAVADTDVRAAGADVAIMFAYGKYGFDIPGFIGRLKSAADQVNSEAPGAISSEEIEVAIAKINQAKQDELAIIEEYFRNALQAANVNLTAEQKASIADLYSDFYDNRAAQEVDSNQDTYLDRLKPLVLSNLVKLETLLGKDTFLLVFNAAPKFVVDDLENR